MTAARGASLLASILVLTLLMVTLAGYRPGVVRAQVAEEERTAPSGARVFARACATCHGEDGEGRIGPGLAGNLTLARSDYVTAIILRGRDGMPPFHSRLSGPEITAVSRYVRSAWGNEFLRDDEDAGETTGGELETNSSEQLVAQWWLGAQDSADLFERVCARCHGEEGGGGFGPPLAQNENLRDPQYVAGKILHGQGGMPAFEGMLSVRLIAALASHVRNSFGNSFGEVDLTTVSSLQSEPPGARRGALRASVFPGGARITILGPDRFVHFESQAGTSQDAVRLAGLLPGSYSVAASRDGYRTANASVEVRPLQESRVTLNLQSFPADPPNETGERDTVEEEPAAQVSQFSHTLDSPAVEAPINAEEYRSSCALCHGPNGAGGVGPPLAGNTNLQNTQFVLDRILNGMGPMPAFADRLTDEQIAAIATHERVAWGNGFGPVAESEVAQQRQDAGPRESVPGGLASAADTYESLCSVCHGGLGFGGVGPPFQGNERLRDTPYTLSRIVMGGDGMPAFNEVLSSAQMAQLATFIRTEWGNEFGPVRLYQAQNYHGGPSSRTP